VTNSCLVSGVLNKQGHLWQSRKSGVSFSKNTESQCHKSHGSYVVKTLRRSVESAESLESGKSIESGQSV